MYANQLTPLRPVSDLYALFGPYSIFSSPFCAAMCGAGLCYAVLCCWYCTDSHRIHATLQLRLSYSPFHPISTRCSGVTCRFVPPCNACRAF